MPKIVAMSQLATSVGRSSLESLKSRPNLHELSLIYAKNFRFHHHHR